MFRFTLGFIVLLISLNGFCESGDSLNKVIVLPIEKLNASKSYSKSELVKMFEKYYESYEGKKIWGQINKVDKPNLANHTAQFTSVVGTARHDFAAGCYRCALGRSDLVNEADCREENLLWNVRDIELIKKKCN